jgi:hypothetical protein
MDKENNKVKELEFLLEEQRRVVSWKRLTWPLKVGVVGGWLMVVAYVLEVILILLGW